MPAPIPFKFQTTELQPSGKEYSDNVTGVEPMPIWSDGEQCVSCWKFSWWDRLRVLLFGRVWVAVLSGKTQPPVCLSTEREYLTEAERTSDDT